MPTREKTRTASVTSVTRACDTGASTTPLGHYSVETLLRRGAGKGVDGGRPVSKNLEAVWVRGGWGAGGTAPKAGTHLPDPRGRRASSAVPSELCRRGPAACGKLFVWCASAGVLLAVDGRFPGADPNLLRDQRAFCMFFFIII